MPLSITPSRLTSARELRELTMAALARECGVAATTISNLEGGRANPSEQLLDRLSLALRVPPQYLLRTLETQRPDPTAIHYRGRARIPARNLKRLEWLGALRREVTVHLHDRLGLRLKQHQVPRIEDVVDPAEAAREVREFLGFTQPGPVRSMVRVLEFLGVDVHVLSPGETDKVSAYCYWHEGHPVVVHNPAKYDTPKWRFDFAHELGHLVMHDAAATDARPQEREADAFAGEFLVPSEAWEHEAPLATDPEAYLEAKARWKVTVKCLLYRSRAVGVLSESEFRWSMIQYSKLGWQRGEPDVEVEPERPTGMRRLLQRAASAGIGASALAAELRFGDELLREALGQDAEALAPAAPRRREVPEVQAVPDEEGDNIVRFPGSVDKQRA